MRRVLLGFLGLTLAVAGCTGPPKAVTVSPGGGEKVIQMKASSFDFDPSVIQAHRGDRLVLLIHNTAGIRHNITVKDPAGEILVSKDLPAKEVVRVKVPLTQAGEYSFYCDRLLHAAFGMKGRLVVTR